jgi:CRP/FNR family transcriptional regulator, cyclic AMP receptor protein
MNPNQDLIHETLQMVPWIAAAGPEVLDALAAQSRLQMLGSGEQIARRGQPMRKLIVVAHGKLETSMTSAAGKHHVVGYLTHGMVCGLIPVLDEKSAIHDVCALGAAQAVMLPREALMMQLQKSAVLMHGTFRLLCGRSRLLYESLADQSLLSTHARVARHLLQLATDYGSRDRSGREPLAIELPQSSLADMLGLTRQSLNIELKRLEKFGLIQIAYSKIDLLDLAALRALANPDDV